MTVSNAYADALRFNRSQFRLRPVFWDLSVLRLSPYGMGVLAMLAVNGHNIMPIIAGGSLAIYDKFTPPARVLAPFQAAYRIIAEDKCWLTFDDKGRAAEFWVEKKNILNRLISADELIAWDKHLREVVCPKVEVVHGLLNAAGIADNADELTMPVKNIQEIMDILG